MTIHTIEAIYKEIEKAENVKATLDTSREEATYEDGVIDALLWILGKIPSPFEDVDC
ncbi:hypothetical protein VP758_001545 [Vibrio harveyi]|nr:hypothetical protein [Vibrio harveyi]